MAGTAKRAKLAAILSAVVLLPGTAFGNVIAMNTSAPVGDTALQAAESEEKTILQTAEDAAGLQKAGEETISPDTGEADPKAAETEQETVPQAAEEPEEDADEAVPERETDAEDTGESDQPVSPPGDDSGGSAGADDPENEEAPVIIGDEDAVSIAEEFPELFSNPELYEQTEFIGTAEIRLVNEGMLGYGDEIILKADVRDVNVKYHLVWEANDNDGRGWFVIGSGEEYRFVLDSDNVECGYRVVVFAA